MWNLLSANFLRLRKSKLFWGLLASIFAYGLYTVIHLHLLPARMEQEPILFDHADYIVWVMAVFVPFFLGPEHTGSTIRNKVIGGHTRLCIYLAHLTTTVLVSFCFCAAYMLPTWGLGSKLLAPPNPAFTTQGRVAYAMLAILAMGMAFCAFYTAIVLNNAHTAGALVVCILAPLVLYFTMNCLPAWLTHPSVLHNRLLQSIGEFALDFLPSGQELRLSSGPHSFDDLRLARLPLMSLLFTAASTAAGMALFRLKDLK